MLTNSIIIIKCKLHWLPIKIWPTLLCIIHDNNVFELCNQLICVFEWPSINYCPAKPINPTMYHPNICTQYHLTLCILIMLVMFCNQFYRIIFIGQWSCCSQSNSVQNPKFIFVLYIFWGNHQIYFIQMSLSITIWSNCVRYKQQTSWQTKVNYH